MNRRPGPCLAVSLIFVLALAFVADPGRAQSGPGTVRLTRVGTIGDIPPGSSRVVVEVDSEGAIRVRDRRLDLASLRGFLLPLADSDREDDGMKASRLHAVLRIDRDAPWQTVAWTMQTCADPGLMIYRLYFAVLPEEGDEEGYLAAWLPKDVGLPRVSEEPAEVLQVEVELRVKGPPVEPAALYEPVRRMVEETRRKPGGVVQVSLAPQPRTPMGYVLRVMDVLHRAGVSAISFRGTAIPPRGEESGGAAPLPGIRLAGEVLTAPAGGCPDLPPVARTRGGYAGTTVHAASPGARGGPARPEERKPPEEEAAPPFEEALPPREEAPDDEPPFTGPSSNAAVGRGGGSGAYRHRNGRKSLLRREGGSDATESAVTLGLEWLGNHQDPGGHWDCDGFMNLDRIPPLCDGAGAAAYDPGVSGLALLAFLGTGESHKNGRFKETIRSGLKYLKQVQDPEGCFGPRTVHQFTYNHAIATLAMVENYGLTGSPLFRDTARMGVDFIRKCQNPYLAWRYGVRPGDNDTSVSGWMVSALHAARTAGLEVGSEGFEGMCNWLGKITDPESGRAGYASRGTGPARSPNMIDRFPGERSESLTAIAVLSRVYAGEDPRRSEPIRKGADLCLKALPRWDPQAGSIDLYYWYYGSLAMFQVGGPAWQKWNAALKTAVLDRQRQDGAFRGSWDPIGPWGPDGGRVYSTAITVLCLETCYRYQRIFGESRGR